MRMLLVLICCVLAALWLRPWRVRPRPLDESVPKPHRPQARPTDRSSRSLKTGTATTRAATNRLAAGGLKRRRMLLIGGLGFVSVGVLQPLLVFPLILVYGVVLLRGRKQATYDNGDVAKTLPEVVDLLLVGVNAGFTPRETLQRCQAWLPDPFGTAVDAALARAAAGATFTEALDRTMTPLGDRVRPLLAALNAGERDGSSLAAGLLRVSDEARRRRRVAAQERARRVPVAMLGPLLLCVLPSFALLTLAPLVLGSLKDLGIVI